MLNSLHVPSCEMLHVVMSYMNLNRKQKQTLESAQYELEIIFEVAGTLVASTADILLACHASLLNVLTSQKNAGMRG